MAKSDRMMLGVILALGAPAASAAHEVTTEYGVEFSHIGDPGNRPTRPGEWHPLFPHQSRGSIEHEYRMARTEVTLGQYVEFVEAYYPHYIQRKGTTFAPPEFTSPHIRASPFKGVYIQPRYSPDRAASMSWEYAARYVNWLHNGKVNEPWAFDTGVYDTSTFVQNPDGSYSHQTTHSPDAKFWMPSADEWLKAAYWDPEKDGGEGGYWLFPNGSDEESRPGLLPEEGGERNAGQSDDFPLPVQSFEHVQSPWGLFDMAGGVEEWSSTQLEREQRDRVFVYGSHWGQSSYEDPYFPPDLIGSRASGSITLGTIKTGLRLAAAPIPSVGTLPALAIGIIGNMRRYRP